MTENSAQIVPGVGWTRRIPSSIGRLVLLGVFISLVIGPLAPLARASGTAAIWTDKPDYHPDEVVTISGSGFLTDATVTVTVTRPNGDHSAWDTIADPAGNFTTKYQLDGITGTYLVSATDGTNTATTSFVDSIQVQWVQCSNDANNDGVSDTPMCTWQNGDLNQNNAIITEGNNPPAYPPNVPGHVNYRAIFESLPAGTYDLTVRYQFTKGGKVAFDFLTTNYGVTNANLCDGLPGGFTTADCNALVTAGASTMTFPSDSESLRSGLGGGTLSDRQGAHDTAFAAFTPRTLKMYGVSITSITANARAGSDAGDSDDSVTIRFVLSADGNVMTTWGGHLGIGVAAPVGYGTGNGAASISGAPFHMTLDVLARISPNPDPNVISGSRARSVQPGAVVLPATLLVRKHVINDNGGTAVAGDFTIHVTIGGLDVAGSPAGGSESGTSYLLSPGTYTVSENPPPAGYTSVGVTGDCASDGTITLAPGGSNTCTITNDDQGGHLVVVKHVINDNGGTALAGDFTITVAGNGPSPATFPGAESPGTSVAINAGSYSVSESGPSGYTSTFSTDCSGSIVIGETKTCTITNDDKGGHLVVIKHVINDNGGAAVASDFTITVTGNSPFPGSFPGAESPGISVAINAGSYGVTESGPSGYTSSFSTDCSGSMGIGETKTCTITNDDIQPKLIVIKHVINDNGGTALASDFTITVTATNANPGSFPGAESPGTSVALDAGAYSVGETGSSGYSASFSTDCSGSIAVGETQTCTITNDDIQPTLIVIKHVINDNGGTAVASDFTITVTGNGASPATFPGAESPGTTVSLNAGTYSVGESGVAGYAGSSSPDCTGSIGVGETKTCTITNDDIQPKLTVVKFVINDNGGTATAADFTIHVTRLGVDVTGSPQAGSASGTTYSLDAGMYVVGENDPASVGYAQTGITCSNGDRGGPVTLVVGTDVTCTITNDDIQPRLIVIKHVDNGVSGATTTAGAFTMSVTGNGPSPGSFPGAESPGTTVSLNAGAYSVSEVAPDGSYYASLSSDCSGSISVGQVKTCTITNTKRGNIIVQKYSFGGTGTFTFTLSGSFFDSATLTTSGTPGFASHTFSNLVPSAQLRDTYALVEIPTPGWSLMSATCSDGSSPSAIDLGAGETVTCTFNNVRKNLLTDSALCTFDRDTSVTGSQFRLLFTQDPTSPAFFKVTATNPGQFYYNIFVVGTGTITLHLSVPYPFVTQGANPIHAYDGATIATVGSSECITPGTELYHSSSAITLGSYTGKFGSFATLTITFSRTGFTYVNVHLDYGLKATTGWSKGGPSGNDGVGSGSYAGVTIADLGTYVFSYAMDGDGSDSQGIQNENAFKRDPGFGGQVVNSAGNGVSGVLVTVYTPEHAGVLGTVVTDSDGFYLVPYKHTGKAATFFVSLQPAYDVEKAVEVKANSFVWVNFQV